MDKDYEIVTVADGFRQCEPMPSAEELDRFYAERYFHESELYTAEYDQREIEFFRAATDRKLAMVRSTGLREGQGMEALEVGVGEGWTLQVLQEHGFSVTGIDYSDSACTEHNPTISDRLLVGRPEAVLENLIADDRSFELIWLDNVLEHSPEPARLLERLHELANREARLVIEVPNDYSRLQLGLLERGHVSEPYWEAVPEHLSYFRADGLVAFCEQNGWSTERVMSDFPIDIFLLNEHSNYAERKELGKGAHWARIAFDEIFRDIQDENMIRFLEAAAAIGLGRNLVGVFSPC